MPSIDIISRPASDKEKAFIAQRLIAHSEESLGRPFSHQEFSLLAQDGPKTIGAIIGKIFSNWLHLDLVWVDDAYRGQGIGANLLKQSLRDAKSMGLGGVEVWTQSWQAPKFYLRHGFHELVAFDDFIPGQRRHILRYILEGNP